MNSRFSACILHDMTQRSEAWYEIRRGKLTASVAGAWLASEKLNKTQTKARDSVIDRLIAERMGFVEEDSFDIDPDGPPPNSPSLRAIYYGIKYEPEALSLLSFDKELDLEEVGFCEHESGLVGSSPDSLVFEESVIVENKVTMSARTQIGRIRKKTLPDTYRDQVHFQMATTGAQACWFQSYHPELEPLQVLVHRDAYTQAMVSGIHLFQKAFNDAAGPFESQFK